MIMLWALDKIADRKEAWANGEMLSSFAHEQFVKEAVSKGYISAMRDLTNIEIEELIPNE